MRRMTTNTHPVPFDDLDEVWAREYLRVSYDKSGRVRSNEEQHDDNLPHVERHHWRLGVPYEDVGSASKYQRKRRLDFERLIADLTAGTFDARVMILWEGSRGSRKVSEWAHLLELIAAVDNRIWVTTDRRLYDPSTPRDWKTLMEDAVESEYEARKTSRRTRRSSNANADAGTFSGGRRPFGYEADGVTVNKDEATIIRRCVKLAIAGRSIRTLAAELNRAGVKTTAGNDWSCGPLKQMLTSARIVGKRVHHGVVVGDAAWPAIIDEATHKRLVAIVATRAPIGRRGRTTWLLTGLLRCSRCGANLQADTDRHGIRRYVCRAGPGQKGCGRLGIRAENVEELLGDLATERLADVEARRHAAVGPDDSDELAALDEIAAMRVEAADDRALGVAKGGISRGAYNDLVAGLDRRQAMIEAALAGKVRDVAPLDFVAAEGFVGRAWSDLDVDDRRHVLDALIDHVTVAPATTLGSKTFEPGRITKPGLIVWRV